MEKNSPKKGKGRVGRPRKSETTAKRQVNIYLQSMVQKEEWTQLASDEHMSLSNWIKYRVEDSLSMNGDGPRYSRKHLIDRNADLEKTNRALEQDLEIKSKAYEALDGELKTIRVRPFMDPVYQGYRELHRKLVATFREKKRVSYADLYSLLGIHPTDIDTIKAVSNQIEILLNCGVIEQDLRYWRWIQ